MKTICVILAIAYGLAIIPSLSIAIAFWLCRNEDTVANKAMRHGFLLGFISIWLIYPVFVIKDCFTKNHE